MTIIALSGKQGSGKTTLAKGLLNQVTQGRAYHYKFADPLYAMHDAVIATLSEYGIALINPRLKDGGPERIDGRLLQLLGTEWGRNTLGEDVWVRAMDARLKLLGSLGRDLVVVVDDVRFLNELHLMKSYGALCVRLDAPEEVRKQRAEKWREDTGHLSEVAIDAHLSDFDIIMDTHQMGVEESLEAIQTVLDIQGRRCFEG